MRCARINHRDAAVAAAVHAIQMAAYTQEAALLGITDFPPLRRTVADIQADDARYFGALIDDELVGVVSMEEDGKVKEDAEVKEDWDEAALFIASLVVAPAWQRRGVARQLLARLLADAGNRPVRVTTGAANAPALALYAAFGFVEESRRELGPEALNVVTLRRPG